MHKRTIIYRGNLKSCNYSCSYCPFAKHRALQKEMEKDRQSFERFCDSIEKRAQAFSIGAVFYYAVWGSLHTPLVLGGAFASG